MTDQRSQNSETFSSNHALSDALGIAETLSPQGRKALFEDARYFPVFFAYYFPEYIKYPFADFHFRMFADSMSLLQGDIRACSCRDVLEVDRAWDPTRLKHRGDIR